MTNLFLPLTIAAGLAVAAQPAPDAPAAEPAPPPVSAPAASPAPADDDGSRVVRGDRVVGLVPWQVQFFTTLPIPESELAADRKRPPAERRDYDRMSRIEQDHLCGAVLIAPDWALTAAHCLVDSDERFTFRLDDIRVRLGSNSLNRATVMRIERAVVHADYWRSGNKQNDIAMIRIEPEPGRTDPAIARRARPIPLVEGPVPLAATLVVTGWGSTGEKEDGAARDVRGQAMRGALDLLQGRLRPEAPAACGRTAAYRPSLGPGTICAVGADDRQQDTCQGDSGGPLTMQNRLVGLVSWGLGCGRKGVPGIYTRVGHYAGWIRLVQAHAPAGRISRCKDVAPDRLACI